MSAPTAELAGLAASNRRLLDDLAVLTDDELRMPSRLPDWTVGHVLAHLARNADGFTAMVTAAAEGRVGAQYPGGFTQRGDDIEAGASRSSAELVADIDRAIRELTAAWDTLDAAAWRDGVGLILFGERRVLDMPFRRWREVELHHVDLGLERFGIDDLSEAYVDREMSETLATLPARLPADVALQITWTDQGEPITVGDGTVVEVEGTRRWVLGWLTGRIAAPHLPALSPWF